MEITILCSIWGVRPCTFNEVITERRTQANYQLSLIERRLSSFAYVPTIFRCVTPSLCYSLIQWGRNDGILSLETVT